MKTEQIEDKDNKRTQALSGFTFKVLSGALNGIEFALGRRAYFFFVGDATKMDTNLAFAERTIHLPGDDAKHNFILDLENQSPDNITHNKIDININFQDHQETKSLTLNTLCQIEGVAFAIKREEETWSEAVQKGVPQLVLTTKDEASAFHAVTSDHSNRNKVSLVSGIFVLLLVIGCSGYFGWYYLYQKPAASLVTAERLQQIVGDKDGFSGHSGKDNMYYLFAANAQKADWANQAIVRQKLTGSWKIVTAQSEEIRLTPLLERSNVAFFAIRFQDPVNPTLLLSKTRNVTDEQSLRRISDLLLSSMLYASDIRIVLVDDAEVLAKAQQGLHALGLQYQLSQSESGITLNSWMPAVDVQLSSFSHFVAQFYQTWGRRYINFTVDMHEDDLKEKSYKYGEDGYISMSKSNWLFNKKLN